MLQVETQPRIPINRMSVIEESLRCPDSDLSDLERRIDELEILTTSIVLHGEQNAERFLDIAKNVFIDVRIARKRVTGTWDPVITLSRGRNIDSINYALSYSEKLSQRLRRMATDDTRNMAMVITTQLQERILEDENRTGNGGKIWQS